MLMGQFQHSPRLQGKDDSYHSQFRELVGDTYILAKGLDGCLFVYPLKRNGFLLEQELKSLPFTQKALGHLLNSFYCWSWPEAEMDKQGRILMPPSP